jgi:hypothetical protein
MGFHGIISPPYPLISTYPKKHWAIAAATTAAIATTALLAAACAAPARGPASRIFHLSRREAAFFVQDNLVGSRLLDLEPGGAYRQIDVDTSSSTESDRGTWTQDAQGAILLHPACGALRFRALTSGPLTVVLDRPGALAALPPLRAAIRRFLALSEDDVFAKRGVAEILATLPPGAPPRLLAIDPAAETFSRADLISLARQTDDLLWSERTNTYILSPVPDTSPQLLVLQDALFQARDLPRVRQEYRIPPGDAPPF